jgi:hypothetical protein
MKPLNNNSRQHLIKCYTNGPDNACWEIVQMDKNGEKDLKGEMERQLDAEVAQEKEKELLEAAAAV